MDTQPLTSRNRINQQRSRARRKDYIVSLETRLRRYEQEGVKASTAIQLAARQVADENAKLKDLLLHRFGVADGELKTYLSTGSSVHLGERANRSPVGLVSSSKPVAKAGKTPTHPDFDRDVPTRSPAVTSSPAERTPPQTPDTQSHHTVPNSSFQQDTCYDGHTSCTTATIATTPFNSSSSGPGSQSPSMSPPPSRMRTCTPMQTTKDPNSTPCDLAATLIASTRIPAPDPESIWPELGCSSSKATIIANVDMFRLMDIH